MTDVIIVDDDGANFYSSLWATLSNDISSKKHGADSLKVVVTTDVDMWHYYNLGLKDLSANADISFWFKGCNSGVTWELDFYNADYKMAWTTWIDNSSAWQLISIPRVSFATDSGFTWAGIYLIDIYNDSSFAGTVYFDYFVNGTGIIPTPSNVSIGSISPDYILSFVKVLKTTVMRPEYINQLAWFDTSVYNTNVTELQYTFRASDADKYTADLILLNHKKVALIDYINNISGTVWMTNIEAKYTSDNWAKPWEITVTLISDNLTETSPIVPPDIPPNSPVAQINDLIGKVNWNDSDIEIIYIANVTKQKTLTDLENAFNALTDPLKIFKWANILSPLYSTGDFDSKFEVKIKWALDNQSVMTNGLPDSGGVSPVGYFLVYHRYLLSAYAYAQRYSYRTDKWVIATAYASLKATAYPSSTPVPALWMYPTNTSAEIGYGPRYYDEAAQTLDCFLQFYDLGVGSEALTIALAFWTAMQSWFWIGTHYQYAVGWTNYECEFGFFYQIIEKLANRVGTISNSSRILDDISNRLLSSGWSSPQWWSTYVIVHHNPSNDERRLQNDEGAWGALLSNAFRLSGGDLITLQDMMSGATPAWRQLESVVAGLWTGTQFKFESDGDPSNLATANACGLSLILGVIPDTAALAFNLREQQYEDYIELFDPELFNINVSTGVVRIALSTSGSVKFHFGNNILTQSFGSSGIYEIAFGADWDSIASVTFIKALPSNRTYVYDASL